MALDFTRSKRQIQTGPTEGDIPQLQSNLHAIGRDIEECQKLAFDMGMSDEFGRVAGTSLARFLRLFERDAQVPMTAENLAYHAEMRGRMLERYRLTLELPSVKIHLKTLEKKKNWIEKLIARVIEKGEKDA